MSTAQPQIRAPAAIVPPQPAELPALLRRIVKDPARHGRFANTLSYMEYIGARKILKSQPASHFGAELLAHTGEEIRHAHALKMLALRLDPSLTSYAPEQLLDPKAASGYLQSIDRQAEADLKSLLKGPVAPEMVGRLVWINYLYTTLLIEERAGSFYPAYAEALAAAFPQAGYAAVIQRILREEEQHLRRVMDHLLAGDPEERARLDRLRAVEAQAFAAWMMKLDSAVA